MSDIIVWSSAAGSGKTHAILQREAEFDCALTVTRSAAAQLIKRGWSKPCLTIYQATAKHVRHYVSRWAGGTVKSIASTRAIEDGGDAALRAWLEAAPSRRRRSPADEMAERLHGWNEGPLPLHQDEIGLWGRAQQLSFVLPLARWLEAGAPLADGPQSLGRVACDEFQDWSALEIRCALALGATLEGYGDAGQAIFAQAKGCPSGSLPAGWRMAKETRALGPSRRCGPELSLYAAGCLKGFVGLQESAWASHETTVQPWDSLDEPKTGLVLAFSRADGGRQFKSWGLRETWVRATELSKPNEKLCLATIHDAKGMEADDVFMLPWPDMPTKLAMCADPATMLLLYTAITRARKRLFIPRSLHWALQWKKDL